MQKVVNYFSPAPLQIGEVRLVVRLARCGRSLLFLLGAVARVFLDLAQKAALLLRRPRLKGLLPDCSRGWTALTLRWVGARSHERPGRTICGNQVLPKQGTSLMAMKGFPGPGSGRFSKEEAGGKRSFNSLMFGRIAVCVLPHDSVSEDSVSVLPKALRPNRRTWVTQAQNVL